MKLIAIKRICFLLFLFCSWLNAENFPTGQLPGTVMPLAYDLQLKINPTKKNFSGTAQIELDIRKPLRFFWMHGNRLTVSSVIFKTQTGKLLKATYEQVSVDGVVKITLPEEVVKQQAKLILKYEATLKNELSGLYKVAVDKREYAFTQFEPIAARECFPGFDEPRFKTPFHVSLIVPKGDVAIANTSIALEKSIAGGQKLVKFAQTKPLPTYLVAFAVGPFDVVESKSIASNHIRKNEIPFRAISVKGMKDKLHYALQHTPKFVQLLEEYFQIPYPYEKLDIVAVPDFASGAMENAGLITFRESLLLIDDKTAPISQKRSFAYVMAHELAHQWFGNLVTMSWWNDLWLNEAFATWMEYRIIEQWNPAYMSKLVFQESIHDGMRADAFASARQIMQPIGSYHDIYNAFDPITYEKGAGVLSMFESYLGATVFQKGIQHYLNQFAFGTATAEDFVRSLSAVSKKNLHDPFFSFINQPGVPLVKVDFQCDSPNASLELDQFRYFPVGSEGDPKKLWQIPLCYRYEVDGQTKEDCLLIKDAISYWDFDSVCPDWILLNVNAAGYFRWTLPVDKMKTLSEQALPKFKTAEQLDFVSNVMAGFYSGDLKAELVLSLLPYFIATQNRFVATAPIDLLTWLNDYVVPSHLLVPFRQYVTSLYASVLENLLAAKSDDLNADEKNLFEIKIYALLANVVKDSKTRAMLKEKGGLYIKDLLKKKTNADTQLAFVSVPVWAEETPKAVVVLKNLLLQTGEPMQRSILLSALAKAARARDTHVLYDLLLGNDLRRNEVVSLLGSFMQDPDKREEGWIWLKANYEQLAKVLPEKKKAGLSYLASGFCSAEKEEDVKNFFQDKVKNLPGGPLYLKEVLEQISLCQSLVAAQKKNVEAFLMQK